ncbi:hypothetical protein GEMRC1_013266 [Eukaryota sp. GEM-RC1]
MEDVPPIINVPSLIRRILEAELEQLFLLYPYSTVSFFLENQNSPADTWVVDSHCVFLAEKFIEQCQVHGFKGLVIPCVQGDADNASHAAAVFKFENPFIQQDQGYIIVDPGLLLDEAAVIRDDYYTVVYNHRDFIQLSHPKDVKFKDTWPFIKANFNLRVSESSFFLLRPLTALDKRHIHQKLSVANSAILAVPASRFMQPDYKLRSLQILRRNRQINVNVDGFKSTLHFDSKGKDRKLKISPPNQNAQSLVQTITHDLLWRRDNLLLYFNLSMEQINSFWDGSFFTILDKFYSESLEINELK